MHITTMGIAGLCMIVFAGGCGGPPSTPSSTAAAHPTASSLPPSATASAAAEPDEDAIPTELQGIPSAHPPPDSKGMIPLLALLPVPDPAPPGGFPSKSMDDQECVRSVGLVGQLDKDFRALTSACGNNAGMKEYAKAVSGKLDGTHKADSFQLKLAGGYCYRFFAVADGSISKLGFRVHRANGALHSVILGKQPVLVYRPGQAWCRRRDRDFQFVVETLEGGEGRYAFGIWARPNEKGRAAP